MKTSFQAGYRFRRRLSRLVVVSLLLIVGAILCLGTVGFPSWLVQDVLQRAVKGQFSLMGRSLKLDLAGGLILRDAEIYSKGVIGAPLVEADEVRIRFNAVGFFRRGIAAWDLRVSNGEFRPSQLGPPQAAKTEGVFRPFRGHFSFVALRIAGVTFDRFEGDIGCDGSVVWLTGLDGAVGGAGGGAFSGDVLFQPSESRVSGRVDTRFDPHTVVPVFDEFRLTGLSRLVERFDFRGDAPRWDLNFARSVEEDGIRLRTWGDFRMETCAYRGVPLLRVDGSMDLILSPSRRTVTLNPLLIVREEGLSRSRLTVDFVEHTVRFDGTSTLEPNAFFRIIGLLKDERPRPWRFNGGVRLEARGTVGYRDIHRTRFTGSCQAEDAGLWDLDADRLRFDMAMTGPTNRVTDIRSDAYGGTIDGKAVFVFPPAHTSAPSYRIEGRVRDTDFSQVSRLFAPVATREYEGNLSGRFTLQGPLHSGSASDIVGEGSVSVDDGRIFLLPLFGEFTKIMAKTIPGVDFVLRQSDMKAEFTIADGKVLCDKASIEGDILSLGGHGSYGFDETLDFDVQVKLLKEHTLVSKLVRPLTYPLSKLFEFRLHGSLEDAHWYPVHFTPGILRPEGESAAPAEAPGPTERSAPVEETPPAREPESALPGVTPQGVHE